MLILLEMIYPVVGNVLGPLLGVAVYPIPVICALMRADESSASCCRTLLYAAASMLWSSVMVNAIGRPGLEINDKSWVMSSVVNRFTNRYWHTAIRLFLDAMRTTEPTYAKPKERNSNERGSPEAGVVQIRKMDEVDPEAIIVNLGCRLSVLGVRLSHVLLRVAESGVDGVVYYLLHKDLVEAEHCPQTPHGSEPLQLWMKTECRCLF